MHSNLAALDEGNWDSDYWDDFWLDPARPFINQLRPELHESYILEDGAIQHALLDYRILPDEQGVKSANTEFELKSARVAEAVARQDWDSLVWLYTRPFRMDALYKLIHVHKVPLDRLWPLVASIWTDSENIRRYPEEWRGIWSYAARRRKLVMSTDERARLRNLPDKIDIWRGVRHENGVEGFSWTLNRDIAVWYAKRFSGPEDVPVLAKGRVKKRHVLAYFEGRSEEEIVLLPEHVYALSIEQLKPKPN